MSNMSYCRMVNTYEDLQDCFEHWDDEDMSDEEQKYRQKLLKLCREVVMAFDEEFELVEIPTFKE